MKKSLVFIIFCLFGAGLFGMKKKLRKDNRKDNTIEKQKRRINRTRSLKDFFRRNKNEESERRLSFSCRREEKVTDKAELQRKLRLKILEKRGLYLDYSNQTNLSQVILKDVSSNIEGVNLANSKYIVEQGEPKVFGVDEIVPLSFRKELNTLDLTRANFDDEGLEWFVDCAKIKWLNLSHTKITDAGVLFIAEQMPKIETLILRGCDIRSKELFTTMKNLKKIDLSFCTDLALTVLKDISKQVEEVHLNCCRYINRDNGKSQELEYRAILPLIDCKKLKKLTLCHANIHDESLTWFPESVQELDLSGTKITIKGLEIIAQKFLGLKKLIIKGFNTSGSGLEPIEQMRKRGVEVVTKKTPKTTFIAI